MIKLKQIRIIFLLILISLSKNLEAEIHSINDSSSFFSQILDSTTSNKDGSTIVYICTGVYAEKYHSRINCTGLNNCKGSIIPIDFFTAVNSNNRTPCCICYNCAGTSSGGGGGGDSNDDAVRYAALAIVVASAAVLSNDFYIYPVLSFKKPKDQFYKSYKTSTTGWAFGFRKTFQHCALEYGASNFKSSSQYSGWNGSYYTYSEDNTIWGIHMNFVHQIFYNKTADWLKFYTGPTVNLINYTDLGYGAIIGAEMKIKGRLKFDTRYELSTETNQIRAGLIFNYQKKYLWQKR